VLRKKDNLFRWLLLALFSGYLLSAFPVFADSESDFKALVKDSEQEYAYNPYDPRIKNKLSVLYHNHAMELANDGQWDKAIEHEKRALEISPDVKNIKIALASLYNSRALELKDQGLYEKAVNDLKAALDCNPDEVVLQKNLGAIYLAWAYKFSENNEYSNAERMLLQVERYDSENPYLYVLRGDIAYSRDNYSSTRDNWERALKLNPSLYQLKIKLEKLEKEQNVERNYSVREIENFKLKFEGIETEGLADNAAETLRDAYKQVGKDFDLYPRATVPVIIYPSVKLKDLDYFPDWAAGTYDGKIRFGADLAKDPLQMQGVLYHEYTHVIVRMLGADNVPLWLNEGLAEYEAHAFKTAQNKKSRQEIISRAIANQTIFSLDKLGAMDLSRLSYLSPNRIELVYAQSEAFVQYMINRASLYDMKRLLEELGKGTNIYKAVKEVLFVDLDVLERDWQNEYLK
jgi:tetratricopeptide (TPR) repeat protein